NRPIFERPLTAADVSSSPSSGCSPRWRQSSLPPSLLVTNLLHFDRFVNAAKICAEAKIQAAEKEAAKIPAKAEAEGESAEFLVAKREYDYKQKKLVVETSLLEAVPLVVSGKMATN
ncbi:hypothetical protein PF008_g26882, partial [Phytophthora fragariae]